LAQLLVEKLIGNLADECVPTMRLGAAPILSTVNHRHARARSRKVETGFRIERARKQEPRAGFPARISGNLL
jgi:hypothetical protein